MYHINIILKKQLLIFFCYADNKMLLKTDTFEDMIYLILCLK